MMDGAEFAIDVSRKPIAIPRTGEFLSRKDARYKDKILELSGRRPELRVPVTFDETQQRLREEGGVEFTPGLTDQFELDYQWQMIADNKGAPIIYVASDAPKGKFFSIRETMASILIFRGVNPNSDRVEFVGAAIEGIHKPLQRVIAVSYNNILKQTPFKTDTSPDLYLDNIDIQLRNDEMKGESESWIIWEQQADATFPGGHFMGGTLVTSPRMLDRATSNDRKRILHVTRVAEQPDGKGRLAFVESLQGPDVQHKSP